MKKGQIIRLENGETVELRMDCTTPRFEGDKATGWIVMPIDSTPGQIGYLVTSDELDAAEII